MNNAVPRLRVISLGAGVQSTTMALMAAHGEITPMPDCAIFADTQAESAATYEHLAWLSSGNVLPFPVVRITEGNITENVERGADGKRWASIPAYTATKNGRGKIRRQCTSEFKVRPLRMEVRRMAGLYRKVSPNYPVVEQWIGISLDEIYRQKPSGEVWWQSRHPLLEKRLRRTDCERWLISHGYPVPPKSACIWCPFRSNEQWRGLSEREFAEAVRIDQLLRSGRFRGMRDAPYLHDSLRPLAEVDLSVDTRQTDMFINECEGMCGV